MAALATGWALNGMSVGLAPFSAATPPYWVKPSPSSRSAEICVCEIFGRDVGAEGVAVGMGVHPFGDPKIVDDFSRETIPIDAREFHVYAAEWTPDGVVFFVDGNAVKRVGQSPDYPMQLMLGIYEFPAGGKRDARSYPKSFVVDYVRGYRLSPSGAMRRSESAEGTK